MFPGGVDESRKELDYAHKVFEDNEDHTAHPRTQHHHHGPAAHSHEIKREQMEEQRFADTQSPGNGDVDMDRPEDHADDESQTPGGQSDNSGHETRYHQAVIAETQPAASELQSRPTPPAHVPAPAPASNASAESSATLPPASSTQTLAPNSARET